MDTRNNRQQTPQQSSSAAGSGGTRRVLAGGVTLVVIVVIAGIYLLSTRGNDSSPVGGGAVTATNADTILTPQPTAIPPTEPPTEVAMQDRLRNWLGNVVGVTQVQSLDIDVPSDEPPLIYSEVDVSEGYNDTGIPDAFVAEVNQALGTTEYSDFVIIMNDGTVTIEYDYNSQNATWTQTVLSGNPYPEK